MVLGFFRLQRGDEEASEGSSDDERTVQQKRKISDVIVSYREDDDVLSSGYDNKSNSDDCNFCEVNENNATPSRIENFERNPSLHTNQNTTGIPHLNNESKHPSTSLNIPEEVAAQGKTFQEVEGQSVNISETLQNREIISPQCGYITEGTKDQKEIYRESLSTIDAESSHTISSSVHIDTLRKRKRSSPIGSLPKRIRLDTSTRTNTLQQMENVSPSRNYKSYRNLTNENRKVGKEPFFQNNKQTTSHTIIHSISSSDDESTQTEKGTRATSNAQEKKLVQKSPKKTVSLFSILKNILPTANIQSEKPKLEYLNASNEEVANSETPEPVSIPLSLTLKNSESSSEESHIFQKRKPFVSASLKKSHETKKYIPSSVHGKERIESPSSIDSKSEDSDEYSIPRKISNITQPSSSFSKPINSTLFSQKTDSIPSLELVPQIWGDRNSNGGRTREQKLIEDIEEIEDFEDDESAHEHSQKEKLQFSNSPPPTGIVKESDTTVAVSRSWLHKMHSVSVTPSQMKHDETFPSPFTKNTSTLGKYGKLLLNSVLKIRQSQASMQHASSEKEEYALAVILQTTEYYGKVSLFCEIISPTPHSIQDQFVHIFMWRNRFDQFELHDGKHFRIFNPIPDPTHSIFGTKVILGAHFINTENIPEDWSKRRVNIEIKRFCTSIQYPLRLRTHILVESNLDEHKFDKPIRTNSEMMSYQPDICSIHYGEELFQTFSFSGVIQRVFEFFHPDTDTVYRKNFVLVQIENKRVPSEYLYAMVFPASFNLKEEAASSILDFEGAKISFKNFHITSYSFFESGSEVWDLISSFHKVDVNSSICVIEMKMGATSRWDIIEDYSNQYAPPVFAFTLQSIPLSMFSISGELIIVNNAQAINSKHGCPSCVLQVYISSTKEVLPIYISSGNVIQKMIHSFNELTYSARPIVTVSNLLFSSTKKRIYSTKLTTFSICEKESQHKSQNLTQDLTQADNLDSSQESTIRLLPFSSQNLVNVKEFPLGSIGIFHIPTFPVWEQVDGCEGPIYFGCEFCRAFLKSDSYCTVCQGQVNGQNYFCLSAKVQVEDEEVTIIFSHDDVLQILGRSSIVMSGRMKLEKVVEYMKKRFPATGISVQVQIQHQDEKKCIMTTISSFETSTNAIKIALTSSLRTMNDVQNL